MNGLNSTNSVVPLLLQWQYLVFLLPLGAAGLLLALSALHLGGHSGGHAGHAGHSGGHTGHMGGGGHAGHHHPHGSSSAAKHHAHPNHSPTTADTAGRTFFEVLTALTGWGRAPLPLTAGVFCLLWGFAGYWADRVLLPAATAIPPSPMRVLPSLLIALSAGLLGARLATALFVRLLPSGEDRAVSRDALFGLTGKATFPVSETAGRLRVYDEFGTFHDEPCRLAPGQAVIAKGARLRITDRDRQGHLLVEEA